MIRRVLVLDSWPVMEWLKAREPAATRFDELIGLASAGRVKLIISSLNLGEVYYNCHGVWGEARAEEILPDFDGLPVQISHPKPEDVLSAARLKARYKCSYADSFVAVLASKVHASVVTGDPDFLKLRDGGTVSIEWWGK